MMRLPFKMTISLKIFLGYFLLVGLAAWFVLTVFVDEVKPGVRQAMENTLVDTANVLASLASNEVKTGKIQSGNFSQAIKAYLKNPNTANIWGVHKNATDYRIYITNTQGIVIYDSANIALGQDYSRWNDVYLTLRGKYGVRSSPVVAGDEHGDSIMYIAAPIKDGKKIIGSLTVAKPNRSLLPFIERAQLKIMRWGLLLFVLSLAIGVLFTWRFTSAIHRLRDYAIAVAQGKKASNPSSSNDELAELANAMQSMRHELDGKQHVQDAIHQITHELKSPITAIQAASELMSPNMPAADQLRFLGNIQTQSQRLQNMIQNILGLAALEHQQQLVHRTPLHIQDLITDQIQLLKDKASKRDIQFALHANDEGMFEGDRFLLSQAINNLLENALDFSPNKSTISITLNREHNHLVLSIQDQGTGIPEFAMDKIFDKFYSLPRPEYSASAGQKSTGLGLNFVKEVILLHGGTLTVGNAQEAGVKAIITL
jgi:two-component system sensor histidine kinase CreC